MSENAHQCEADIEISIVVKLDCFQSVIGASYFFLLGNTYEVKKHIYYTAFQSNSKFSFNFPNRSFLFSPDV